MNLTLLLLGGRRVRVAQKDRTRVLDLCLSEGLSHSDFSCEADGSVCFSLPLRDARRLLSLSAARGWEVRTERVLGIPALLFRLLRRPGIFAGGVLGLLLLLLSGQFVWAVEVTGNETVGDAEIEALLAECGVGVGSYLPDVRVPETETRVLLATDRISWISINLSGTVARVQVIERREGEAALPSGGAAHLVAARDGQIEYVELFRGTPTVRAGQAVRAGEMLVSGIYTVGEGMPPRYTRAAGRVMARTERTLEVFVPYGETVRTYGEAKTVGLRLNFFNFSLNFFENSGNMGGSCDIIENEWVFPVRGRHRIPISLTRSEARPYTVSERVRTEEETVLAAYAELEAELASLSADVLLLEKRVSCVQEAEGVRLVCRMRCVEDIASPQAFEIGE